MTDHNELAQIAELRGELRVGISDMRGDIKALTEEVRSANNARVADINEIKTDVADHELRIRAHNDRMHELESRPHVTPKGMWAVGATAAALVISAIGIAVNALV